jgi:hypothetical protein
MVNREIQYGGDLSDIAKPLPNAFFNKLLFEYVGRPAISLLYPIILYIIENLRDTNVYKLLKENASFSYNT